MTIVITKEGNLSKVVVNDGEPKYFNISAMANSFSLDTTSPITVASRSINMWDDNTPLSEFTIAGHSGMTTVGDFDTAITDLTTLTTA